MATPKSTPIQQLPQQLSPPTPPSESISSQMSTSINDLPNNQQPPNLTPENLQQPNGCAVPIGISGWKIYNGFSNGSNYDAKSNSRCETH